MTEAELRRKLAVVEAERDDLARQLAGIRDQFNSVKRAYLTKKAGGAPTGVEQRIADLEATVAQLEEENKSLKRQLVEALRGTAATKTSGKAEPESPVPPPEAGKLDAREVLKKQLGES